jgi:hypothetical protein
MPATVSRRRRAAALLLAGLLPAALAAGLAPAPARANDRDLRGTTVPPPACHVTDNYGVPYPAPNGGYFAVYGPARYIRLSCPLPINNVDLSGKTDDNDMSKLRVYYRDGDGYSTEATLTLSLSRQYVADGRIRYEGVCVWNSDRDGAPTSAATTDEIPCVHDLGGEGVYWFDLRLETGTAPGQAGVEFMGFDFP